MRDRFLRSDDLTAPDGFCRLCKQPVKKPRRNWCSQRCVDEYLVRSSGSAARHAVFKRDAGVCAECHLDTERIDRILERVRDRIRVHSGWTRAGRTPTTAARLVGYLERLRAAGFKVSISVARDWGTWSHLWEADHITPVVEGGGGCGIDNLRTLCIPCHRTVTAELAARLATKRKRAKRLPLLDGP